MAKKKALTLKCDITEERWETAKASSSGGCLISDALKDQYPHLSNITTDAATVRATDREEGVRYIWLTPRSAAELLLSFDQGWGLPDAHSLNLGQPVKVIKVRANRGNIEHRRARLAGFAEKESRGEPLTPDEKRARTLINRVAERPASVGPVTDVTQHRGDRFTVHGGTPPPKNPTKNPNLLAGRDRLFGVKSAQPSAVFAEAVERAVAERLAETE